MISNPQFFQNNKPPMISIVVPCYNEESVIEELYERITEVCLSNNYDYELLLVDDGSSDNTWNLILQFNQKNPHVRGVKLSRNHGHQLALSAGLHESKGQRIFMLDADMQDPPELLPKMMAIMDQGADIVYGKRQVRKGEPWWRLQCIKFFYTILNVLSEIPIPHDSGDFRLINRKVLDALLSMPEYHRFIRGMLSWVGFEQRPLLYQRMARVRGESKYPLSKLISLAVNGITSFSIKPLKLSACLALALGGIAACGSIYVLIGYFVFGKPVQGWTSLSFIILFIGALQLFVLGIIGEYLGRLFMESKRRPLFFIQKYTPHSSP